MLLKEISASLNLPLFASNSLATPLISTPLIARPNISMAIALRLVVSSIFARDLTVFSNNCSGESVSKSLIDTPICLNAF